MPVSPSIPPRIAAQLPESGFERWLAVQVVQGHDRHWLRRNATVLRQRYEAAPDENLPPPIPAPEKPYDRYAEL